MENCQQKIARIPYAQSPIYGNPLKPHEEKALAVLMSR